MVTIIVDDRQLVVSRMMTILKKTEPTGEHHGFTDVQEALEFAAETQVNVAFLDVEMPGMSGIELAKKLQQINPRVNIIFITGYKEYTLDAFSLYASGYLLKPIREEDVRDAFAHLRYPLDSLQDSTAIGADQETDIVKKVRAVCFGNFELYCGDKVINFPRARCKELIAYLVDRKGAVCTNDMIMGNLWPERVPNNSLKSMLRTLIAETKSALEVYGVSDIVIKESGGIRIDASKIDCDYYRFLDGDSRAARKYTGEYMSQYSFAEETRAALILKETTLFR